MMVSHHGCHHHAMLQGMIWWRKSYHRPDQISPRFRDCSTSVSATVSIVFDLLRTMGPKRKPRNWSDDTEDDDNDHLALRLIELLTDEQVLSKLKSILFPKDLKDMLDSLNGHIQTLNKQLGHKEECIKCLKMKMETLESESDKVEQYSRHGREGTVRKDQPHGHDTAVGETPLGENAPTRMQERRTRLSACGCYFLAYGTNKISSMIHVVSFLSITLFF